jgi:hypothetical protein
MKARVTKLLAIVATLALLLVVPFHAQAMQYSFGSGKKTADSLIYSKACKLLGIMITTDGTNDVTVKIYDNTSATGTVLPDIYVPASARTVYVEWVYPRWMNNGIYVDVTTSGTVQYEVYFQN